MTTPSTPKIVAGKFGCEYCPHPAHPDGLCTQCKCKGKKSIWKTLFGGLGRAIGEAKFGGGDN
jgi:hypothetical protein